jgi:hypothetical protein
LHDDFLLTSIAMVVKPLGQQHHCPCGLVGKRIECRRFKVFKHLNDWWEEFRLYHRKDGRVVKEGDDLMSATRYALMMLRFASTKAAYDKFRRPIVYPRVKYF